MTIFDVENYKDFVVARVQGTPRGAFRRMAHALKVNSSMVSQVFRGPLHLTPDQAILLCDHLALAALERDCFLLLVQRDRAGTPRLKRHLDEKIKDVRATSKKVIQRFPPNQVVSEADQATFYSDWTYSAVRLLCGIVGQNTVDAITRRLRLSSERVREILDFLISRGLAAETNGVFSVGPSRTHLDTSSPLIGRHHANWRLQAMTRHASLTPDELAFSSPMTLSREDFVRIRALLLETIQKTHGILGPSPNEVLACMNIDWFELK